MFGFTLIEFSSFGLAENFAFFFFFEKKNTISIIICFVCVCVLMAVKTVRRSVTQSPPKYLNVEHSGCVWWVSPGWVHRRVLTVVSCVSGEPWRLASCTSSFWASCSQAPRICCDPRSSQLTPSWRAGAYGRFTAAWCCWCHSCSALTTSPCSAAACWSRRSSLSSSGRNSTTTQLR